MPDVDWLRVREEIRALRAELGYTREELEEMSDIEQTTIYRIENTKKLPNHKPDFESIESLVRAMGLTLSEFFARIEDLTPTRQTEGELPSPNPSTPKADHGRSLSAAERSADSFVHDKILGALVSQLAEAIDRLVDARTQDRSDKDARSTRRRRTGTSR